MNRSTSGILFASILTLVTSIAVPANAVGNTAPTLDSSRTPGMQGILEDAAAPTGSVGTLVSSLVDTAPPSGQVDNISDPDGGALLGIAVTAVNTSNCIQVSYYNGSAWTAISSVSTTSALLLPADGTYRIYCQPTANFSGSISDAITFQAWDRTSGAAGDLADATINGGSTAFSSASDVVTLYVTPQNDAPILDDSRTPNLSSMYYPASAPSGQVGSSVVDLVNFAIPAGGLDNVSDADSSASLGMAITASDTATGTLYFSIDGGSTWTSASSLSESNALLLSAVPLNRLYFDPGTTFVGRVATALTFRAWDTTSRTSGNYVNITSTGGTTAFSSTTDTISLTVIQINSAPVLDPARTPVLISEQENAGAPTGVVGTPVSSLVDFVVPVGGLDNVSDSNASPVTGIAVVGADSVLCANWYFYDGSTWTVFPLVSSLTALLLPANGSYRVYCQPVANSSGTSPSALTIRAWDQVSGTAGSTMAVGAPGGTTTLSFDTDTVSLTINPTTPTPSPTPGSTHTVTKTANVYFESSSAKLTSRAKASLDALIKKYPNAVKWEITGFVRVGGYKSAQALSAARASAVRAYLKANGVKAKISVSAGGYPRNRTSVLARRATLKVTYARP